MNYKGWDIYKAQLDAPVTGRYKAYRYGVRIGAGTMPALKAMIDVRNGLEQREQDEQRRKV